ncbi:MAG: SH3 domain-containing protein [archaeon]|nr:SH3 domain-containing protein [archaeon]
MAAAAPKRTAKAAYDFNATKDGQLSLKAGDLIATGKQAPGGWILATNEAGKFGYVFLKSSLSLSLSLSLFFLDFFLPYLLLFYFYFFQAMSLKSSLFMLRMNQQLLSLLNPLLNLHPKLFINHLLR